MLNLDFSKEENRSAAYKYLNEIMEQAFQDLVADDSPQKAEKIKNLFNTETQDYLMTKHWKYFYPFRQNNGAQNSKN